MIDLKQFFLALRLIKLSGLSHSNVVEGIGHVTQVLKESRLAQTRLILGTGHSYDLIEEVSQWQDNFASLLAHDLEQTADLKSGHVDNIEGVIFFSAISVGLDTDKMLKVVVVALAQKLEELE